VRQAGQHTHRNQWRASSAQKIVGENSIGMRLACRSFHAATSRPASARICASVARGIRSLYSGHAITHFAQALAECCHEVREWPARTAVDYHRHRWLCACAASGHATAVSSAKIGTQCFKDEVQRSR
jgi:hypothetical protein